MFRNKQLYQARGSILKIVHWAFLPPGTSSDTRRCPQGWHHAVRSSCPGQWYLLRRQRDVTDRELALWLRSGWGPGTGQGLCQRGDTRSKTSEEEFFSCVFGYRCSLSKHMVRRGGSRLLHRSTIYILSNWHGECTGSRRSTWIIPRFGWPRETWDALSRISVRIWRISQTASNRKSCYLIIGISRVFTSEQSGMIINASSNEWF